MDNNQNLLISETLRNPENAALPKTVRVLPKLVRFENQGNTLSSDQIYQAQQIKFFLI